MKNRQSTSSSSLVPNTSSPRSCCLGGQLVTPMKPYCICAGHTMHTMTTAMHMIGHMTTAMHMIGHMTTAMDTIGHMTTAMDMIGHMTYLMECNSCTALMHCRWLSASSSALRASVTVIPCTSLSVLSSSGGEGPRLCTRTLSSIPCVISVSS